MCLSLGSSPLLKAHQQANKKFSQSLSIAIEFVSQEDLRRSNNNRNSNYRQPKDLLVVTRRVVNNVYVYAARNLFLFLLM